MNITVLFSMTRKMCQGTGKAMTPGRTLEVFTRQKMAATDALDFFLRRDLTTDQKTGRTLIGQTPFRMNDPRHSDWLPVKIGPL
jgi:hypothetical protein